ncbi:MAG: hypothetical protein U9Q71_01855 [Pseudomonadota bacterium]|nr:hypothetical protein [Pseudomonadota bacterium]
MNQTDRPIRQAVLARKSALAETVSGPMAALAERCTAVWPDPDRLDALLTEALPTMPERCLLYAWGRDSIEVSSMVQRGRIDPAWRGRDLSRRPYLKNNLPFRGIMLSSVYTSAYDGKRCLTALQAVNRGGELLGFITADFHLSDLLRNPRLIRQEWQQYRGDPAVRGTLFLQQRVPSRFDAKFSNAMERVVELIENHGVFHAKIHFSSSRASLWFMNDPYGYQILDVDELLDPDLVLAYPERPYPEQAQVEPDAIRKVFREFEALRFADENVYLRSASVNIINGMLGLTFSCDGSHYMPVREFLEHERSFWLGDTPEAKETA